MAISGCVPAGRYPAEDVPHWDYDAEGPGHWADLDRAYLVCQAGREQSPIDLSAQARLAPGGDIGIEYGPVSAVELVNTGHTIQGSPVSGDHRLAIGNQSFRLAQFHFHLPGEHTVDGVGSVMELHLVHKSETGAAAVLGILLQQGAGASVFDPVLADIPGRPGAKVTTGPIDLRAFVPADTSHFRYQGSLTTPPCSEGVAWTVLRAPVAVSAAVVDRYRAVFPHSNRPVQPLNGRTVIVSNR
ncbi:carbonic anhydrase [Nocardia crassostreae]|uniref:carbonic anhydrase n=1 Tax=Nocardia crassostreae TaxID=53428 RepID=UPI000AAD4183|nr:carbonic anhydrase family protein [Nocardia crassostreae]